MSINQSDRSRDFQVLDPCLLGRPVHLLPAFATRLAEALGAAMASPGGRRYWGVYRLESLAFERAPDDRSLRWLGLGGPYGLAAVAFERSLLLGLLEGRYARRTQGPNAAPQRDPGVERVTATEERLAATLAQQVATLVDERIAEGLTAAGAASPAAPQLAKAGASIVPASAPGKAGWVIRAVLRAQYGRRESDEPGLVAPEGRLWIGLDHGLMAHVLQGLMAERNGARGAGARMAREPLASHLQVKLEGRLVSKEVTLAALFGLKVGDVIPVSVGRADVLLDDSRLFTAAVAEHKGKLCLTSFEDAE
ncbi:FliM/FliN family flagellar motor switch protein [Massilia arenae]|uniref:FliM/FliN family flagellar motor switch protein n=1 Tax=Massilia arenae TaxID=2603288 RepID=A0A5C7G588_9BURK|nr:FliM/FliN family flagellar motor C-terminal domain-containing protein [Massilia arenae]TXF99267.1 FliM/FliN family flagellar motor switch protein [Massilia arenae]